MKKAPVQTPNPMRRGLSHKAGFGHPMQLAARDSNTIEKHD